MRVVALAHKWQRQKSPETETKEIPKNTAQLFSSLWRCSFLNQKTVCSGMGTSIMMVVMEYIIKQNQNDRDHYTPINSILIVFVCFLFSPKCHKNQCTTYFVRNVFEKWRKMSLIYQFNLIDACVSVDLDTHPFLRVCAHQSLVIARPVATGIHMGYTLFCLFYFMFFSLCFQWNDVCIGFVVRHLNGVPARQLYYYELRHKRIHEKRTTSKRKIKSLQ